MALDHVLNSKAGRNLYEVISASLFRATFIPPAALGESSILTEHILSVSGFKNASAEAVQQQHHTARRNYASVEVDNTQNITIAFSLNLNDEYQNYVFNKIIEWRSLVFDPLTGTRGLKKDYVGRIIIENYAADGKIFWERTLHNMWPSGDITGGVLDSDTSSHDPLTLDTSWVADYYTEKRV